MPVPLLGAIAPAMIATIGQGLNMGFTQSMNKKTQQWNEKMYGIQRADALADWAMQNSYNHPSSQMARLREAGLNPNLVYGTGSVVANSQSQPRATDTKPWNPETPKVNLPEVLSSYQDFQLRQAQVDNLRVQNDILLEQTRLKKLEVIGKTISNDTGTFNLEQKKKLGEYVVKAAEEGVRKTRNEADLLSAKVNEIAVTLPMKKYKFDVYDKEAFLLNLEKLMNDIKIQRNIADMQPEQRRLLLANINKVNAETLRIKLLKSLTSEELGLMKDGLNKNSNSFLTMLRYILKGGKTADTP